MRTQSTYYHQDYLDHFHPRKHEPQWHLPTPDDARTQRAMAIGIARLALRETLDASALERAASSAPAGKMANLLSELAGIKRRRGALLDRLRIRLRGNDGSESPWLPFRFAGCPHPDSAVRELVTLAFYRLMELRTRDPVVEHVCALVVEEAAPVLGRWQRGPEDLLPFAQLLSALRFEATFLVEAWKLWVSQRVLLAALGAERSQFIRHARRECVEWLGRDFPAGHSSLLIAG